MLTADLVKLRRRKGRVEWVPRAGLDVAAVVELARPLLEATRAMEGASRAELVEALSMLTAQADAADALRLQRALTKLILDRCSFGEDDVDRAALRHDVFLMAAQKRAQGTFVREQVLAEVAAAQGTSAAQVDADLFADLKDAQRVGIASLGQAADLVEELELRELQAVLLRAERVRLDVGGSPAALRGLLRALKLHQLLFDASPTEQGLTLQVEGPMALFDQTTRYGLKLALLVPSLQACETVRIEAQVRLRRHGAAETFVHELQGAATASRDDVPATVTALQDGINQSGGYRARLALDVVAVPGVGAFVPDLAVERLDSGEQVLLEVLGFWSRQAVWKRVELVEQGLLPRALFCVSDRLRVSEAALPSDAPSSVLVFKGVIPVGRVLERLDALTRGARVKPP